MKTHSRKSTFCTVAHTLFHKKTQMNKRSSVKSSKERSNTLQKTCSNLLEGAIFSGQEQELQLGSFPHFQCDVSTAVATRTRTLNRKQKYQTNILLSHAIPGCDQNRGGKRFDPTRSAGSITNVAGMLSGQSSSVDTDPF